MLLDVQHQVPEAQLLVAVGIQVAEHPAAEETAPQVAAALGGAEVGHAEPEAAGPEAAEPEAAEPEAAGPEAAGPEAAELEVVAFEVVVVATVTPGVPEAALPAGTAAAVDHTAVGHTFADPTVFGLVVDEPGSAVDSKAVDHMPDVVPRAAVLSDRMPVVVLGDEGSKDVDLEVDVQTFVQAERRKVEMPEVGYNSVPRCSPDSCRVVVVLEVDSGSVTELVPVSEVKNGSGTDDHADSH